MPRQYIEFTLIRPVFRSLHQTILDWIFPEIKPLLMIAFAVPQLPVEKIALPNRLFRRMRPAAGCLRPPKPNPLFQRRNRQFRGCAKKVQMIRHDNVASHQPMVGLAPTVEQWRDNFWPGQQRAAFVGTNGNVLENGLIREFQRGQMRKRKAARFSNWLRHETRLSRIWIVRQVENGGSWNSPLRKIRSYCPRMFSLAHRSQRIVETHGDVPDEQPPGIGHFEAGGAALHQTIGFKRRE